MNAITKSLLSMSFSFAIAIAVPAVAQEPPGSGMPVPPKQAPATHDFVSHVGHITGHADWGKEHYRRFCIGCHGVYGDGNGENAQWIDPKPRDFTIATFKCRSTPTGTLPTDEDLFEAITRGFNTSNMPQWRPLDPQRRADLVAYIKTFSPRWQSDKAGAPITIPPETPINIESIARGKALYVRLECWKCHGPLGRSDGPSAATLTDSKDLPIKPYNFSTGGRLKCGETNRDLYRDFMTGIDGTPMPSFADNVKPDEAWDLVHFLRTLQVSHKSPEMEVLRAHGGKIPDVAPPAPPAQDNSQPPQQDQSKPPSSGK